MFDRLKAHNPFGVLSSQLHPHFLSTSLQPEFLLLMSITPSPEVSQIYDFFLHPPGSSAREEPPRVWFSHCQAKPASQVSVPLHYQPPVANPLLLSAGLHRSIPPGLPMCKPFPFTT